jgi:molecular chaperone GrpE
MRGESPRPSPEQTQEKDQSQKKAKKPGLASKFADSFGFGKRWEKEAAYIDTLPEKDIKKEADEERKKGEIPKPQKKEAAATKKEVEQEKPAATSKTSVSTEETEAEKTSDEPIDESATLKDDEEKDFADAATEAELIRLKKKAKMEEQGLTDDEIEDESEKELAELKDKFTKLNAEFERIQKRIPEEQKKSTQKEREKIFFSLLPTIDSFDRAKRQIEKAQSTEAVQKGIDLISRNMKKMLEEEGIQQTPLSVGETFNPEKHDAVTTVPAPSENLKGKVIEELESGYEMDGKIIRFPKVVVGK